MMNKAKIERLTSMLTKDGYTQRRINNRLAKEEGNELEEKNQRPVNKIVINIEWKKSQMWGWNPSCEATIEYKDGGFERSPIFKCSGCGYDKESTVVSQVFNAYLKYTLWNKEFDTINEKDVPYGIRLSYEFSPSFEGGVGTNCYRSISEFIGGEFTHVSCGKSFDVYQFEAK